jgi:uncharacterized OsmC-like protein
MIKVNIEYEGDLRCQLTHPDSGANFRSDAPVDNEGDGSSFSPTDLCASALGSCIATIIGMRARKLEIDLRGMWIEVTKVMSADAPRRIARLETEIWMPRPVTDEVKAVFTQAASACPVHHSLHPEIEKPIRFHWK